MKKICALLMLMSVAMIGQAKVVLMDFDQVVPGSDFVNDGSAGWKYGPPAKAFFDDYVSSTVYTELEHPSFGIAGNEQLQMSDANGGYAALLRYSLSQAGVAAFVNGTSGADPFLVDVGNNPVFSFDLLWPDAPAGCLFRIVLMVNSSDAGSGQTIETINPVADVITPVSVNLMENETFTNALQTIASATNTIYPKFMFELWSPGSTTTVVVDNVEINPVEEPPAVTNALYLMDFDQVPGGSDFAVEGDRSVTYNPPAAAFWDAHNTGITYTEQEDPAFGIASNEQCRIYLPNGGYQFALRYNLTPSMVRNYLDNTGSSEEPFLIDLEERPLFKFDAAWLGDSSWNTVILRTNTDSTNGAPVILTKNLTSGSINEFSLNLATNSSWVQYLEGVAADTNCTYAQLNLILQTGSGDDATFVFDNFRLEQDPNASTNAPPSDGDVDDDGIPDEWETLYFGGATNANPEAMAANGINTINEAYIAGLNPTNAQSILAVAFAQPNTDVVQWSAVSGRVYSVYTCTNLLDGFQPAVTNIQWPQNSWTSLLSGAAGFYQLKVELAP
jgi:hypothetical protein